MAAARVSPWALKSRKKKKKLVWMFGSRSTCSAKLFKSQWSHKPYFQANKIVFLGFQLWVCMFVGAILEGYCKGENFSVLSDLGKWMLHWVLSLSLFYPSFLLPQHCSTPPSSHHHYSTKPSSSPSLFCPSLLPASSLFCCHRTLSTPMSVSNAISLLKVVCVCVCAQVYMWVVRYVRI